jgi:hypothetical protein
MLRAKTLTMMAGFLLIQMAPLPLPVAAARRRLPLPHSREPAEIALRPPFWRHNGLLKRKSWIEIELSPRQRAQIQSMFAAERPFAPLAALSAS